MFVNAVKQRDRNKIKTVAGAEVEHHIANSGSFPVNIFSCLLFIVTDLLATQESIKRDTTVIRLKLVTLKCLSLECPTSAATL